MKVRDRTGGRTRNICVSIGEGNSFGQRIVLPEPLTHSTFSGPYLDTNDSYHSLPLVNVDRLSAAIVNSPLTPRASLYPTRRMTASPSSPAPSTLSPFAKLIIDCPER